MMKDVFSAVVLAVVTFASPNLWAAPAPAASQAWAKYLEGKWKVTKYVFTESGARDEKRASEWIGTQARFSAEGIEFGEELCVPAYYKAQTQNASGYFLSGYHTHPKKLGLKREKIQVLRTGCDSHSFDEFILLERNKLLLGMEDAILVLERKL